MVKSGSERSAKYAMKYDAYVLMLRSKLLRGQAILDMLNKGSQANYLLDSNIAAWLQEFPLAYGQRGDFYDMVKSVLSRWDMLTETDKANLKTKWLRKGFPLEIWNRLAAKHDELTTFQLTHKAPNIQVKYEADMFPYPTIAEQQEENLADSPYLVNPLLDFQLDYETMPSETNLYVSNYWRQQNIKKGSCDFNYNWTDAKMDKTLNIQTLIDNLEPLRVDKIVSLRAELLDLLTSLGCVGYWKLDEGSGSIAYDDTINHNDGSIIGATYVAGKHNTALSFDGILNAVNIPYSSSLNFDKEITILLWLWIDDGNTLFERTLIEQGYTNWLCTQDDLATTISVRARMYDALVHNQDLYMPNVPKKTWCFIGLTVKSKGGNYFLYLNGEQMANTVFTNYPFLDRTGIPFNLGTIITDPKAYKGLEDEIMLFNRFLPKEEIQAIMNFETQLFPDRAITLNVAHETESGTAKSSSKTETLTTKNVNSTLAGSPNTIGLNVSYDTELT